MARCDFCFRDKNPLQPVLMGCPAKVCKACGYEIDKVLGFFEHAGYKLGFKSAQPSLDEALDSQTNGGKKGKSTKPPKT